MPASFVVRAMHELVAALSAYIAGDLGVRRAIDRLKRKRALELGVSARSGQTATRADRPRNA
jgi:hypothetical protein